MGDGNKGAGPKALQEFLSEAQDITENLGNNLMTIDAALKEGEPDPDQVNEVFRGMHTLKSLSGMFGVKPLSRLAHSEESLLEEIRLGRRPLDVGLLDILFESVELITKILGIVGESSDVSAADGLSRVDELIERFGGTKEEPQQDLGGSFASSAQRAHAPEELLPPEVLEVLTEYEEHRLRTNLERGTQLCYVHTRFDLSSIDVDLESIKHKLKPVGEIITYLPSTEGDEPDKLAINVILALFGDKRSLEEALEGLDAQIERIEPRADSSVPPRVSGDSVPAVEVMSLEPEPQEGAEDSREELAQRESSEALVSLRSVSQTVRVDIRKLDRLMNVVGELAIVRSAIGRISEELRALSGRSDLSIELHRINSGFDRRLAELREGILEVRMVPLGQMFDRLARMVRKVSRELSKDIHFVMSGTDTEVDKLIIEELSDPLMHIIRNAIDHGVEGAEVRRSAGKPERGTVALTAYQKGNHVVIEVEDDGGGIDLERLVEVAIARGAITEEQGEGLSQRELMNLIFLPGVSTARTTTEISGRGVGMDVVKNNIASLGGVIEVQSEVGIGSKMTITLPVTLAIIPALLVVVAGNTYAVPLNTIAEALFVSEHLVRTIMATETVVLRGQTLPLVRLDEFFGVPRPGKIGDDSRVLVASLGQKRIGLVVDALIGQQDVVIKPLGRSLSSADCFSGATDIGKEQLVLVLDTAAVIEDGRGLAETKVDGRTSAGEWA